MQAKSSKIITLVTAVCALLATGAWAISNKLGASDFGEETIMLPNGVKVYVVRESWGLHADEISLTMNPDGCLPPKPATDYIDTYGDGQSLVYSVDEDGLVLYDDEGPGSIHEPSQPWADVKVTIKKTLAWSDMRRRPQQFGVTVVSVPLNEACWKNFVRRAGTNLRQGR